VDCSRICPAVVDCCQEDMVVLEDMLEGTDMLEGEEEGDVDEAKFVVGAIPLELVKVWAFAIRTAQAATTQKTPRDDMVFIFQPFNLVNLRGRKKLIK